jgi:hypothetical protein
VTQAPTIDVRIYSAEEATVVTEFDESVTVEYVVDGQRQVTHARWPVEDREDGMKLVLVDMRIAATRFNLLRWAHLGIVKHPASSLGS